MTNQSDQKVIAEWVAGRFKYLAKANVRQSTDGSTLSLWGIELGHLVADPVTKKRRGLAILNGDRAVTSGGGWGGGGSTYQSDVRAALSNARIPFVIIPFEACRAARIVVPTIRPFHVEPERYEAIRHRSADPPPGMVTHQIPADADPPGLRTSGVRFGEDWITPGHTLAPDVVGVIHQHGDVRWFDQAVIKRDGMYEWHTNRHWLGDAVFTATVQSLNGRNRRNVPFISSFDRQEARTLYFLSELPRHAVDLDDALEALKPESVATAETMGRTVTRQGDMFGIEMPGVGKRDLVKMGAVFTKRVLTIDIRDHAKAQVAKRRRLEAIVAEIGPRPSRYGANGKYLPWSEYRQNEAAWENRVAGAYNERHGEQMSTWQVTSALRYSPGRWDRTREVEGEPIYGTAHTASMVATLPDGTQLARGCLYHEPNIIHERRAADHARRRLGDGKTWHVLVRNTVPLQTERR